MPDKQNSEIEILARKVLTNTITPEEMEKLERWYAAVPEDAPAWNLEDGSAAQLRERLWRTISTEKNMERRRFKLSTYITAAASILVIGTACFFAFRNESRPVGSVNESRISSVGKITKIYLPDQSIVWLKGDSRLDYPSKFSDSTRNVKLKGEALFEVAKDSRHPFVIETNGYTARVLGTSFNITENLKQFKLTVLTGKVSITPSVAGSAIKNSKPVLVTPGTEFVVNGPADEARIVSAQVGAKADILNGTEYDMNFENTPFEEVRKRIEKKFNVKISAVAETYHNCFLSADVTDQSLDNTLKVLSAVLNAQYIINKDQITLTGGGCNS